MTQNMLGMYLGDLSDADLLVRPVPGANHIAWQLGHLITAEANACAAETCPSAAYPELPAGFAERHTKETASKDTGFGTKAEYLSLFNKVRQATIAALAKMSDADLDKPTSGPIAQMAPTLGALLVLNADHVHDARRPVHRRAPQAGQAGVVLRRTNHFTTENAETQRRRKVNSRLVSALSAFSAVKLLLGVVMQTAAPPEHNVTGPGLRRPPAFPLRRPAHRRPCPRHATRPGRQQGRLRRGPSIRPKPCCTSPRVRRRPDLFHVSARGHPGAAPALRRPAALQRPHRTRNRSTSRTTRPTACWTAIWSWASMSSSSGQRRAAGTRGLFVDAPWRIEAARRARAAGVRVVMVHVGDPDAWFRTVIRRRRASSAPRPTSTSAWSACWKCSPT